MTDWVQVQVRNTNRYPSIVSCPQNLALNTADVPLPPSQSLDLTGLGKEREQEPDDQAGGSKPSVYTSTAADHIVFRDDCVPQKHLPASSNLEVQVSQICYSPLGNKSAKRHHTPTSSSLTVSSMISPSPVAASQLSVRLFIASLGNPYPYQSTRHSAGHVLLKSLHSYLGLPPLIKSKAHAGGHVSSGSEVLAPAWTLYQSPTQMNVSGPAVLKAYRQFQADLKGDEALNGQRVVDALVILHDEMETAPSAYKLRLGNSSAKGHNGIKSVQSSLHAAGMLNDMSKRGKERFLKIGIGIGRPEGKTRERNDVSDYVLAPLSQAERAGIEHMTERIVEVLAGEIDRLSMVK